MQDICVNEKKTLNNDVIQNVGSNKEIDANIFELAPGIACTY